MFSMLVSLNSTVWVSYVAKKDAFVFAGGLREITMEVAVLVRYFVDFLNPYRQILN
jgi:hypothetical protein